MWVNCYIITKNFPNGIKPLGKLSYTNQSQTAHARERAL